MPMITITFTNATPTAGTVRMILERCVIRLDARDYLLFSGIQAVEALIVQGAVIELTPAGGAFSGTITLAVDGASDAAITAIGFAGQATISWPTPGGAGSGTAPLVPDVPLALTGFF